MAAAERLGNGGVHRRVRRRLQKDQLTHTKTQQIARTLGLGGQRLPETMVDEPIDLAETAERRRRQIEGEGAVTELQYP